MTGAPATLLSPCTDGPGAAARPVTVRLDGEDDVAGFRAEARRLVARGVPPSRVSWLVAGAAEDDLFGVLDDVALPAAEPAPVYAAPLRLPAALVSVIERAALHEDAARFALLYRLVWRLAHEPALRDDPLDPDRLHAERLARAVRRDMHKMTAFVRFRPLLQPTPDGQVEHIAWFEPEHHIVEATAPFFARRFAQMRWAILTPERSVRCMV